jgi:hypothetical protein
VLAVLGHTTTTDHISPAGAIPKDEPAGRYLQEKGVKPWEFNTFGSRRGNHEVMMRGTFGNVRIKNRMLDGKEGGYTKHLPSGEVLPIYDASMRYQAEGVPLVILAGLEYGTGSSRDWAAKGTVLLGVKAVIAQSYERIHRSNLVGMGVLPLQFQEGDSPESLGLDGTETFDIQGIADGLEANGTVQVLARKEDGTRSPSPPTSVSTPTWTWSTTRTGASSTPCFGRWPRARCSPSPGRPGHPQGSRTPEAPAGPVPAGASSLVEPEARAGEPPRGGGGRRSYQISPSPARSRNPTGVPSTSRRTMAVRRSSRFALVRSRAYRPAPSAPAPPLA